MHPAILWQKLENNRIRCNLCSWQCVVADGKTGKCAVRQNVGGEFFSLNYDKICAAADDPVEKKPLFHFLPGSRSFSIACPGCNFRCDFCQNWQISQMAVDAGRIDGQKYEPDKIVQAAVAARCESISYTYTEPTVFMELAADCGKIAGKAGLKNIFVSNGYMTTEAVDFAAEWLDAINVDLKAFTEEYYSRLCKAKLAPVLKTLEYIAKHTNIWLEITTLLVPGQNDSYEELERLAGFIVEKCGANVPWHVSRFHPQYKFTAAPATPAESLKAAYEIGKKAGLHYVYIGNLPGCDAQSTYCRNCGHLLIERTGYFLGQNNIINGKCATCGQFIAGVWK